MLMDHNSMHQVLDILSFKLDYGDQKDIQDLIIQLDII